MMKHTSSSSRVLNLRVGDLVEIRSESEILATLDEAGTLDALPFMPEMLKYCGQRVRVYKRADKTCDTIEYSGSRRMLNTVHLEGLRCNGSAHGGCQAGCLLFWKEAWLHRVDEVSRNRGISDPCGAKFIWRSQPDGTPGNFCDLARLLELTHAPALSEAGEPRYRCQATELRRASSPLPWWDVRQYVRDVRSGNVRISEVMAALFFRLFMKLIKVGGYRALIFLYNKFQGWRGGIPFPFKWGTVEKTPRAVLDLKPGELVQVKSHEEILKTLNTRNRNQGLSFDVEMVKYCGGTYRVVDRVEHIIEEKTGRMIRLPKDCIILDGVVCGAHFSHKRLFCPRSLYPFWREIWLKRAQ
jgi:hypothetical protein